MTIIEQGYRLTINSWENDADHRNCVIVEGLTRNTAAFLVELITLLYSRYSPRFTGGERFGNMYEPRDEEIEAFEKVAMSVVEKHRELIDDERYTDIETMDHVMDVLYNLGLSCGEYYTRVLDNFTIDEVPEKIELQDVTQQFTTKGA
jgi:hypothetical protein